MKKIGLILIVLLCSLSGCSKEETQMEETLSPTPTDVVVQDTQDMQEEEEILEETGPIIEEIDGITYVNGILIANKTYSLPSTYNPGSLLDEVVETFNVMKADAAALGLDLYISSAFRSYEYQGELYNNYCNRDGQEAADTYSARPGHSEHQTGLAFDLNTITSAFANTDEGIWVAEHAHEYGFIIRYPEGKSDITGYMYEPWHLRYLGIEIATDVYNSGLCLEEYLGITSVYQD
ncbi:MAG: M15 family metallopeptidase [Erysipelotrichaceae bacterium]